MTEEYLVTDSVDDSKWDEFALHHPRGNIFQTRLMYTVCRQTKRWFPIKLFAVNRQTGDLCGVASGVVVSELGGLLSSLSSHSIIQGGPLVLAGTESSLMPMLMSEYDRLARKRALYSEIRNMWHTDDSLQHLKAYHHEGHLNFLINLDRSEDQLWKLIHSGRRKNINRAHERGLSVEEVSNRSLIPVFYDLLKETYREAGIPLADISLFEAVFETFCSKNLAKYFLAKQGDRYVGARAVLLYNGRMYDWWAGADRQYLHHYPNDILVWHILKWGANNGYRIFDFGGAGKPDVEYGPREFKRRFGGDLVNFGREVRVFSPLRMSIARDGLNAYRRIHSPRGR